MVSNEARRIGLRSRWWRRCAGVLALLALTAVPMSAKLKIVGTAADRTKLQGMLQLAAFGPAQPGLGTVNIDAQGNITLSGQAPTNAFGTRLKMVIDDMTNTVELHAEKTAPNAPAGKNDVFIGGWARGGSPCNAGNGMQSIDLMDLMMLNTQTGGGGLTQQAALIHEIIETWVGVKDMKKFKKTQNANGTRTPGAHCEAIDAESAVISESTPGMTFKRVLDQLRPVLRKLPGGKFKVVELLIIYFYQKVGTNEGRVTITRLDIMNGRDDDGDGKVDEADEMRAVIGSTTSKVKFVKKQKITNGSGGSSGGLSSFDQVGGATSLNDVPGTLELGAAEYLRVYGGHLYASLPGDGLVVRVNEQTGEQDVVFTDAQLVRPHGFALDTATGEFFVADADDNQIVVFDQFGTFLRSFTDVCLNEPAGLDLDLEGNLLVASHFGGQVCHLSPAGAFLGSFSDPSMGDPAGVAYDSSADILFVVDNSNGKVWQFEVGGTLVREFASGLTSPWGIDIEGGKMRRADVAGLGVAPLQSVMVADSAGSVVVYDPEGAVVDTLSASGVFPMAVAFRLQFELYADGFESGDTSAWSFSVP